ncbi:MAG: adenylate/guanylate cyclase domain-containing protein [Sandaracinaceae bacterium]
MSQTSSTTGPRRPLRWKLTVLAIGLVTVPLVAVGLGLVRVNETAVRDLALEVQLAVVEDISAQIADEMRATEDTLETVGRLLTRESLEGEAAIAASLAVVEGAEGVDHVAVYDADGALIDVIREGAASGVQVPDRLPAELRRRAAENGRALGEATAAELAPRVLVVIPLRPRVVGPATGYAATLASLERLAAHVEETAADRFPAIDDALTVVDDRGRALLVTDDASTAPLSVTTLPWAEDLRAAAYAEDLLRQGPVETETGRVVASVRTLPSYRWAIAVQEPHDVVFASVARMRWIVAGTVALAILLAVLVGLLAARRITEPLGALVAFAKTLGERRFGGRVAVATSDELATLGDALSDASVELEASEAQLRKEEAIRGDLRRYLPAEIVDRVVRREQDMALGGERREITVLFADVVGFTPLAEERQPEEVVTILNELFTILTEIVFRHGGLVDKFIGDCVMAIWGAPEDQADHTERAMAAAEEMLRWLETGNLSWQERFGVTIQLAIGVHRGEAVVGNIGSETRMTYTAIGDVVNVAARLEAIARPQQILVTQQVAAVIEGQYECLSAGESDLAGRRTTIELFEVRG